MRKRAALLVAMLATVAGGAALSAPRLGRSLTPQETAQADISISPDGAGLPPGGGTVSEGARIYVAKCEACHGRNGAGGPDPRLTGGVGTLRSDRPIRTIASFWPYATTLFDYTRRAMPLSAPQSLTNNEVYALVAYLLSIDGIVAQDGRLDAKSLPTIVMPNRGELRLYPQPPSPTGHRR